MLNEKQPLEERFAYSEEFIKKLEEYSTIGQNIPDKEAPRDVYIKEKQRHWDFSMENYVAKTAGWRPVEVVVPIWHWNVTVLFIAHGESSLVKTILPSISQGMMVGSLK